MDNEKIKFRSEVLKKDTGNIREILDSTGFFHDFEIDVAVGLAEEYLEEGEECSYKFLFADVDGKTLGYTCFGPIACTRHSFDLYWIGVHNNARGLGLGKLLMKETEKICRELGCKGMYIETSSREKYIPTQKFYDSCNCTLIARIKDFYDDGDDKLIYKKEI